jgi:serine/threonine-protein kinase RsbW
MTKQALILSERWTSCPTELSKIRSSITDACSQLHFSTDHTNAIVLAIDEACSNIIRYAYKECSDGEILVEVLADDSHAIFRLHDYAKKVSKKCIDKKPSDMLKPGGLGVVLMKEVMDSVEFVHTCNCDGNILEMKKDLPKRKT